MVILVLLLLLAATTVVLFLLRIEHILKKRSAMVKEAAAQLVQAQLRAEKKHNSHKSAEILIRSRRIYAQSVTLYEQALTQQNIRPWTSLLGYGPIGEDGLPTYSAPRWRKANIPRSRKEISHEEQ